MASLKRKFNNPKVVLDIGHSKIRALLADVDEENRVCILASSILPVPSSEQMVVKEDAVSELVHEALMEIVKDIDCEVQSLDITVGGEAVYGMNVVQNMRLSSGVLSKKRFDAWLRNIVSQYEESNCNFLDLLSQWFVLDNKTRVFNPINQTAKMIQGNFHLMFVEKWFARHLRTLLESIGVEVDAMVPIALASSYVATSDKERMHGVCHIDIGEKYSNFCVWQHGVPILSGALNQGGGALSQKIAESFFITHQSAQWLKNEHGHLSTHLVSNESVALLNSGSKSAKKIELRALSSVCEREVHRFFSEIGVHLAEVSDKNLLRNLVLSGGGAQLSGMEEFLRNRYRVRARVVRPQEVDSEWLYDCPSYLQDDAGILAALGILKLYYQPLPYQVWAKGKKAGIMDRLKRIFF